MFLVYLLWVTIVFGGFFMGLGAVRVLIQDGFNSGLALMALLYLGFALYGLPKLTKLVFKRG
jgi:hypothetical protein